MLVNSATGAGAVLALLGECAGLAVVFLRPRPRVVSADAGSARRGASDAALPRPGEPAAGGLASLLRGNSRAALSMVLVLAGAAGDSGGDSSLEARDAHSWRSTDG